jgi:septum formation protein
MLLTRLLGDRFDVESPDVDETVADLDPVAEAVTVAARKSAAVAERHPDRVVLGADTTLAVHGASLGQASSADEARSMLTALSGQNCLVTTGLSLRTGKRESGGAVSATVELRNLSPAEIDTYVESGAWIGKAGALEVQGAAAPFVAGGSGCRGTVIGLPVCEVARMLDIDSPCTEDRCVADDPASEMSS